MSNFYKESTGGSTEFPSGGAGMSIPGTIISASDNREYREKKVVLKSPHILQLQKHLDKKVFDYFAEGLGDSGEVFVVDSENIFNIDIIDREQGAIVNVHRINDIRFVNKYFQAVNKKLATGGILIGCVEIYRQRRKRILAKHHKVISYPLYFMDFIVKRVFPKIKLTQWLYFFLTRGQNRAISREEAYGRLYSCGFEMVSERDIDNIMYFTFRKKSKPKYDTEPTYGPFVKLRRVGKDGKLFNVRKFRTMYAYSEYLQDYVYEQNNLAKGGKFKNDFRVTPWGRVLRKFWLDELPMLWNVVKGQIKIVGVRPLSVQYFSLYDKEVQERRVRYKPGLVPPYYVDMPKTLEEIQRSEMRYLEAYERAPWRTQWGYFGRAMWNIFVKRARSS